MLQIFFVWLFTALEAYLLGGIDFGIIISNVFYHDDVRTHGSGAAGMTNMLRTYGKRAAAGTAAGDVLKGVCAVLLARYAATLVFGSYHLHLLGLQGDVAYVAGIFAVIGHLKPIYFGFKGGKGVLVAAGAIIAIQPAVVGILFVVFLVVFLATRIVSLGSVIIATLYPFVTVACGWYCGYPTNELIFDFLLAAVIAGMVLYMHRSNIQRLRNGTEYRFGSSKK